MIFHKVVWCYLMALLFMPEVVPMSWTGHSLEHIFGFHRKAEQVIFVVI